ncbi:hydroperoxidase II, partial [Pseudomonas syringae pv. japonica str. M301072]
PTAGTVPVRQTSVKESPALSQVNLLSGDIVSRKVAILVADGVDSKAVEAMKAALTAEGA